MPLLIGNRDGRRGSRRRNRDRKCLGSVVPAKMYPMSKVAGQEGCVYTGTKRECKKGWRNGDDELEGVDGTCHFEERCPWGETRSRILEQQFSSESR